MHRPHDTPANIAAALARYSPTGAQYILDPAVGQGALLLPVLRRSGGVKAVWCVDSDECALRHAVADVSTTVQCPVRAVNGDFLAWSRPNGHRFDCIVMNPPFAGTKGSMVELVDDSDSFRVRHVPIEAAFVLRAVEMLRPQGRLLSIVPSSIVAAQGAEWLRIKLSAAGAIRVVHELPRRTFPGIDCRFFLFVFDKGMEARAVTLLNHDLRGVERLAVSSTDADRGVRLDFRFHFAEQRHAIFRQMRTLGWQPVGDLALVRRGACESPNGPKKAVHSTDYAGGFWKRRRRHSAAKSRPDETRVVSGDILVKRVGRDCASTFGKGAGIKGCRCSDCVFVIRPKRRMDSTRLLFSIRCTMSDPTMRGLLERGTGAAYVTETAILECQVPFALADVFPAAFSRYRLAVKARRHDTMKLIESEVWKRVGEVERH